MEAVLPVVASGASPTLELPGARVLAGVGGGATRQESVSEAVAALGRVASDAEWVLVHDAARCLVSPEEVDAVFDAAQSTGAAIPVAAVTDTLKRHAGGKVVETPARESLVRALTPQCFRLAILREALDKARRDGFQGTDCSSLVERLGVEVQTCEGSEENFKVTTPEDLERARQVLLARGGSA